MLMWIANVVSSVTPLTRGFGLRRSLYSLGGAEIASTAKINGTASLSNRFVSIGEETWVGARAQLIGGPGAEIRIGARCDIGPDVLMVVGTHEMGDANRRAGKGLGEGITVGEGTWIGARATLLAGASVGTGCMIAAGSVVRGEFPDNVMIAGVPARVVKSFDV